MSDPHEQANSPITDAATNARRPSSVTVLAAVLFLEAAAVTAVVIYLVVEIVRVPAGSLFSGLALIVIVAIGAVWVFAIAINVLKGNAWTRGASIVVQILLIAVGVGSLEGATALPALGVSLIAPAVIVLVLLFAKPVVGWTSRRDR